MSRFRENLSDGHFGLEGALRCESYLKFQYRVHLILMKTLQQVAIKQKKNSRAFSNVPDYAARAFNSWFP